MYKNTSHQLHLKFLFLVFNPATHGIGRMNGGESGKSGPNGGGGFAFSKTSSPHSPTEKWEVLHLTTTHCHGSWCGRLDWVYEQAGNWLMV